MMKRAIDEKLRAVSSPLLRNPNQSSSPKNTGFVRHATWAKQKRWAFDRRWLNETERRDLSVFDDTESVPEHYAG